MSGGSSSEDPHGVQPARWAVGPPAPKAIAWLARATSLAILILIGHWVHVTLGGVGLHPQPLPDGSGNDTGKLFNWHPILMTLGFAVFMVEALLTYQAPLLASLPRETRKRIHWGCHSAAIICLALGLIAVLQSHRLKLPVPMPDWYSPHSYLGITALVLLALQFVLGAYAYLWPRLSLPQRMALGPLHRYLGAATWLAGLGAIATGLQEKITFMQMSKVVTGAALYGPAVRVPAAVLVLLVVLAALVLYFQVPPPAKHAGAVAVGADGSGAGGGAASTQGLLRGGAPALPGDEVYEDEEAARHRAY
ncbi:hypothetical protein CHLRE_13g586600v5 [Chlamydomonas reinhardtii]|uniref:Cytochrome b561 domain-containing protein n=1 Tax=Chlamydomonas reinhardtii TaxID=3055 RepID=A0A2K3D0R1_CHLRE|nr:uncharacterized protein CHLRE_13g586600v5 [Chlamydomonas reinhardtii]PNW74130.1 hypothetical protein CHLRE_13g586600v5 [Chlamydomonas reinhardtii]